MIRLGHLGAPTTTGSDGHRSVPSMHQVLALATSDPRS